MDRVGVMTSVFVDLERVFYSAVDLASRVAADVDRDLAPPWRDPLAWPVRLHGSCREASPSEVEKPPISAISAS
jgi:hypothetical protein